MIKYETTVIAVGEMAAEFAADGVLIFFGEDAPEELHDFAVLTHTAQLHDPVEPGDLLEIDGSTYSVTAVGDVANQNLAQLGHLVVKFNELTAAELPGDISVTAGPVPELKEGMTVRITSGRNRCSCPN
ncbi:MAG: PTS glucitol/sorbitol transporter subunit IIA [Actinomycetes bacterium]|jgi:PTS system glucitol/sorbitol-specific IIA component|nr:PTS sorbitol transporter subunit IIA [Acidimicrobiia bacterium]